jgi:hypothetical protein
VQVRVNGAPRRFRLQSWTVREAVEHLQARENANTASRMAAAGALADPESLTLISLAHLEAIAPAVLKILSSPEDGGEPLDEAGFWLADSADIYRVLDAQDAWSGTDRLLTRTLQLREQALQLVAQTLAATEAKPAEGIADV